MKKCCRLYYLSTIACQLSEMLTDDELAMLSSDLITLSDMIENILTQNSICGKEEVEK